MKRTAASLVSTSFRVSAAITLWLAVSALAADRSPANSTALISSLPSLAGIAKAPPIGRPVRIVSLSFRDKSRAEIARVVDNEAARGVDLVILPETWLGQKDSPETLDGPTIATFSALAKKRQTYVVCPMDRREGSHRFNSAVLLDRAGQVAGVYNKVYPYWAEFDLRHPVEVGVEAPVFQTDFGAVGLAICFDVNFPEVWQRLADRGAELVVWPSAYSAGTSLQAHALNHHFCVVTSTWTRDCVVYDITGEEIHYSKSDDLNVARMTLDLDRGIYHQNFNLERRDRLLKEHPSEIKQTQWLDREQWFVLQATKPGVSARALARQYGLEELRDYLSRSRREIDKRRGSRFAEREAEKSAAP